MPENVYIGTITFNQHYTFERKQNKIKALAKQISQFIDTSKTNKHQLVYTIEYHKVAEQDDYEAPHIHFIYYTDRYLTKLRFRALQSYLKDSYGRTQFYLATNLKRIQWETYIMKDVEKNNTALGYEHSFQFDLNQFQKQPSDLDDLISDY